MCRESKDLVLYSPMSKSQNTEFQKASSIVFCPKRFDAELPDFARFGLGQTAFASDMLDKISNRSLAFAQERSLFAKMTFRGHSRSSEVLRFDGVSWRFAVTFLMALSCVMSEIYRDIRPNLHIWQSYIQHSMYQYQYVGLRNIQIHITVPVVPVGDFLRYLPDRATKV